MNKDIENAVNEFYRLKQEYENDIDIKRKQIKRDKTLSSQQKRQRIAQIVSKCVNCGKQGGSIFSNDNRVLRARCNSAEPCPLNIEIRLPRVESLYKLYNDVSEFVQEQRKDIIRIKLDLLFGYINEEDALGSFNNGRDVLNNAEKYLDETKNLYGNIIYNNRNSAALKVVEEQLFNSKEKLHNLAKQYDDDGSEQYIRDMVELYTGDIYPLTVRIRNLKYAYNFVSCGNGSPLPCEDNVFHLIQHTYTAQEVEMPEIKDDKPSIIANVK